MIRDEQLVAAIAAALRVRAVVCDYDDLFSEDEMKKYNVYNYSDDAEILGHVWAANADDALVLAEAEYGDDVYVLPVKAEAG